MSDDASNKLASQGLCCIPEHPDVGVGRINPEGYFRIVSRGLCRLLGYSRRQLLEKTLSDVTHAGDRHKEEELAETLRDSNNTSYSMTKRCVRRNGSNVVVNETCAVVRDAGGLPTEYIVLVSANRTNVTQDLLELSLDAKRGCLLIIDRRGLILAANSRAERLFACERDGLVGQRVKGILPQASTPCWNRDRERPPVMYVRRGDGSVFPVAVRIMPLERNDKRFLIVSITEYKGPRRVRRQRLTSEPALGRRVVYSIVQTRNRARSSSK